MTMKFNMLISSHIFIIPQVGHKYYMSQALSARRLLESKNRQLTQQFLESKKCLKNATIASKNDQRTQ